MRTLTWPTSQANKGRYDISDARPAGPRIPPLPLRVHGVGSPCRPKRPSPRRGLCLLPRRQDKSPVPSVISHSHPPASSAAIAGRRSRPPHQSLPRLRTRVRCRPSLCLWWFREECRRRLPSPRLRPLRRHRPPRGPWSRNPQHPSRSRDLPSRWRLRSLR